MQHGVTDHIWSIGKLVEKLHTVGVKDSERNLANKITRGSFTAVFLIQCLTAIGRHTVHLEEG
jgi:hypothetical protein